MYSQTKLYAITHVGVSPNETQPLMGKSISFIPLSPALIIITLSLSWMHCPLTHICPTLNK